MASLQVRGPDYSGTKQKALEDARKMQKAIIESCNKSGKEVPQYHLTELIGKGSFGRVYKAKSLARGQLVAVKIIDIEEGDTANPKLADTYSDLLKEINALKILGESGARNINFVIEAMPVGQSMWVVTEYCAGGSVATLMRPTAPGGLQEKWIIPILREVAEAIHWVHGEGIIHRDLKCANVLITEEGNVQLCDFGVAGVIETKFDKRTTFIGTPHWMAPELFDEAASYGTEVDIWAFGAMVYEIASGLPPNVAFGMDFSKLSTHLKQHSPRLDGDQYSTGLKDLVSYCLQHDRNKRPNIEQVQQHRYIFNTDEEFPTTSLSHLVRAFKLWEAQGGDRRSLFSAGGAQGLAEAPLAVALANDDWNFSTTAAFDQQVFNNGGAQEVYDVYGSDVDFSQQTFDEATLQQKPKARRRPPPQLPTVKAPLEKLFDPNTLSSYDDNSRLYYGRPIIPPPTSDLPLRDASAPAADVRESLIDLDASLYGSDLGNFTDMDTIRAGNPRLTIDYDFGDVTYTPGPLSDPADGNVNRRTQDWKFPTLAPPASANPEVFRFPFHGDNGAPDDRPPLIHRPTEPILPSAGFSDMAPDEQFDARASVGSLIDLDMSFADPPPMDYTRPSTSHSDIGSVNGSEIGGANPFELEKHASLYVMPTTMREPSLYVTDDSDYSTALSGFSDMSLTAVKGQDLAREPHGLLPSQEQFHNNRPYSLSDFADTDPESYTPPKLPSMDSNNFGTGYRSDGSEGQPFPSLSVANPDDGLPHMPSAPAPHVMMGQASQDEIRDELRRIAMSLSDHLSYTQDYLANLPVKRRSAIQVATPTSEGE